MAIDLSSMCRTCLESEKSCMIPLFDKKPGKSSSVFEMFQSITSIKVDINDGLPGKICIACFTEINRAYSFKIKCEASEQTLRQLLGMNIKIGDEEKVDSEDKFKPDLETKEDFENIEVIQNNIQTDEIDDDEIFNDKMDNSEFSEEILDSAESYSKEEKTNTELVLEDKEIDLPVKEKKEILIQNKRNSGKRKNIDNQMYNETNVGSKRKIKKENNEEMVEFHDASDETTESNIGSKKKEKQSFKCPHCPADFVFLKNLNKHLEWHKKAFDTQSQFKKNSIESPVLQNEGINIFPKEEIVFETSTIGVHGEEILTTTTIDEIVEESTIEPAVKDIPESCSYTCENCGAGFQTERSLNFHRKLNRCMEKQFECLVCHKIFISKITLIEHIKIHTENFQCSKCMKEFDLEEDFKNHMDNEHVTGKAIKNQCHICKKCFTMLSALKDHMRVHSGEKPFICETCGRGFSQSTNLKQHTMRHSNTKPFKCAQCPCEFVSKGELNSHMRKHTGEHPFVCDTCGSGFTTSSSLKKHIRIHTGERPYACEFCPMRFAALGTLKNHRRTHTGEKPYLCRFCGRGFAQQSDRVTHERTHTGERPYVCSVCGSAFQQNGALKIHMKLHAEGRNSQCSKKRKSNHENDCKDEIIENDAIIN